MTSGEDIMISFPLLFAVVKVEKQEFAGVLAAIESQSRRNTKCE